MKLTIKFCLGKDSEIIDAMRRYTHALNFVSQSAFNNNEKMTNNVSLYHKYYREIRSRFSLPCQMSVSVFKDVAGRYKGDKKFRKNKKLPPISKPIKFKDNHINYVHKRDFSIKNGVLSLRVLDKRKMIPLKISEYHKKMIDVSTKFCDSVMCKNKQGKIFFCLIIEYPEPELNNNSGTMGIDIGLSNLATAYTNEGRTIVIKGGVVKDKRNKHLNLRKRLQSKGTRSAKRLSRKIAGRESRYVRDVNFCAVKKIISFAKENNVAVIGIEDLTGMKKSVWRKDQRREIHDWAFSKFRFILEYKAKMAGIGVKAFDPAYTSQACSKCGFTDKDNRKTQKHFLCKSCGYSQNADINAASNIELLTRLSWYNLLDRGEASHPDVTGVEAKARFRELRRSLITSV